MNVTLRRRRAPAVVWLVTLILAVAILAGVALFVILSQKVAQVRRLEGEVTSLRSEREALDVQLGALQGTATALEARLRVLEAADPSQQIAALQQALDAATQPQEVAELRDTLAQVQAKLDGFQSQVERLAARIEDVAPVNSTAGPLPAQARLSVAPQRQTHNLSCESSAASMVARYFGVDLSEADVLAALPRNDNPHLGFRGNVDGPTGGIVDYGVYAGPIADVLARYGLRPSLVVGGLNGIRAAVARGHPVIAWLTYDTMVSTPVQVTIGDQPVTLVANQHVVVVTGYDAGGFWANDPWDGREEYYGTADMARAMGYFGDMALEIAGP